MLACSMFDVHSVYIVIDRLISCLSVSHVVCLVLCLLVSLQVVYCFTHLVYRLLRCVSVSFS